MLGQRGPAAPGEQRETIVEAREHLVGAEHRCARRRELDGERYAVEAPADRGDCLQIIPMLNSGLPRGHPVDEKPHGASVRNPGLARLGRNVERRHAVGALAGDAQQLAAGCQNRDGGAAAHQRFHHGGGGVDQVLAVVEHEQHFPIADRVRQRVGGNVAAPGVEAEHDGDRGGDQAGVRPRRQLDQPDVVAEGGQQGAGDLQRQPRLADAAGAHDSDRPIGGGEIQHVPHGGGPADQRRRCRRQVALDRLSGRWRGRGIDRIGAFSLPYRRPGSAQAITAAEVRRQHGPVGAESLADCRYVNLERVFPDDGARPHAPHQVVLADQLAARRHQRFDDFKRAQADRDRHPARAQFPAAGVHFP